MVLQNARNVLFAQGFRNPRAFFLRQCNAPVAIVDA